MQELVYCIAEHYIRLHTSDAEKTAELIQINYGPFRVEALPEGQEPILEVYSEQEILPELGEQLAEENHEGLADFALYRQQSGGVRIRMTYRGRSEDVQISADWREVRMRVSLTRPADSVFFERFIMIAFRVRITQYGMYHVHSSVTELGGRALLFLGVSGTGKSTHSRLWRTYVPESTLLNDDEPIVRLMPDGGLRVYGCPWSGSTPCYRNEWAEVVAFVHLHQAPENKITKLRGRDALNALFISVPMLYTDKEIQQRNFDLIADTLSIAPVYRLDCLPDQGALALTKALLD